MSKCGCIRGTYDFSLQQTRCDHIIYTDLSTFQEGSEYTLTPSYELKVTLPDDSIKTYTVTSGTPLDLEFGECMEPGIAIFEVVSCTEKFTKRVALTCSWWCGYLKAASSQGISAEKLKSIREDIQDVELIASTDFITASKLGDKITRELERINCRCSC